MMLNLRNRAIALLRWSERYTKTDMVYLVTTGWWLNLNLVLGTGFSLILSIAFANLLPAATYGTYQYLISLSTLVSAISLSGMGSAVAQAAARGFDGSLRSAVRAQLRWAVVPFIIGLVGAAYYAFQGNYVVAIALVVTAIVVPLTAAFATYAPFLEGKRAFKQQFWLTACVTTTYYASIFLTVFLFKNALILLIVNLGVNVLGTAVAYFITRRNYVDNTTIDPETNRYGTHLSILTAISTILNQIDSVLVFHFLGPVELAIYSFATLIPERAGSFFNFIGSALLPKMANQSMDTIRENIIPRLLRTLLVGGISSLAYVLAAPFLFHHLFPKYESAIIYTQIYAPIIALLAVVKITNTSLFAKRLTKEIYAVGLVQPFLLVALQIPLLLLYGILGMIVARIVTDVIGIVLGLIFLYWPLTKQIDEQTIRADI